MWGLHDRTISFSSTITEHVTVTTSCHLAMCSVSWHVLPLQCSFLIPANHRETGESSYLVICGTVTVWQGDREPHRSRDRFWSGDMQSNVTLDRSDSGFIALSPWYYEYWFVQFYLYNNVLYFTLSWDIPWLYPLPCTAAPCCFYRITSDLSSLITNGSYYSIVNSIRFTTFPCSVAFLARPSLVRSFTLRTVIVRAAYLQFCGIWGGNISYLWL